MRVDPLQAYRHSFEPGETVGDLYTSIGEYMPDDLLFVKDGSIFVISFGACN